MNVPPLLRLAAIAACVSAFTSCALEKAATGNEPTAFLKSTKIDTSKRLDRLPFEHSWRNPKIDLAQYKNIVVRPVTLSYLRSSRWEESKSSFVPSKSRYLRRVETVRSSFDKSLQKAFSSPICMFYKTSNASQPNTLVLEVALTEVRFAGGKPSQAYVEKTKGTAVFNTGLALCGFEAKVRDGSSGKLVATAADRRTPEIKVLKPETGISAKPNQRVCEEWSQQLMEATNRELFPKVKRSWFSLL